MFAAAALPANPASVIAAPTCIKSRLVILMTSSLISLRSPLSLAHFCHSVTALLG
jgi:hypothetical protein